MSSGGGPSCRNICQGHVASAALFPQQAPARVSGTRSGSRKGFPGRGTVPRTGIDRSQQTVSSAASLALPGMSGIWASDVFWKLLPGHVPLLTNSIREMFHFLQTVSRKRSTSEKQFPGNLPGTVGPVRDLLLFPETLSGKCSSSEIRFPGSVRLA
jgi:hypothetical protein